MNAKHLMPDEHVPMIESLLGNGNEHYTGSEIHDRLVLAGYMIIPIELFTLLAGGEEAKALPQEPRKN